MTKLIYTDANYILFSVLSITRIFCWLCFEMIIMDKK